jgi:hypothetical protein
VVQVSGRPRALPLCAAAELVAATWHYIRSLFAPPYFDEERAPRFEPLLRVELRDPLLRAVPRELLLRAELREPLLDELLLLLDVPLRDDERELALRLRLEEEDRPPLLEARLGSFLRFTLAMSWSSFSLIDSAICFEAPRRLDLERSPRLADRAAPAAICCFFDLAGIVSSSSCCQKNETRCGTGWFLMFRLRSVSAGSRKAAPSRAGSAPAESCRQGPRRSR